MTKRLTVVCIEQPGEDVPLVFPIDSVRKYAAVQRAKQLCRELYPDMVDITIIATEPAWINPETGSIMLTIRKQGWSSHQGTLQEYLYPSWEDPYDWASTCWAGDAKSYSAWQRDFIRDWVSADLANRVRE